MLGLVVAGGGLRLKYNFNIIFLPKSHNLILLPAALVHYRWNNGESCVIDLKHQHH